MQFSKRFALASAVLAVVALSGCGPTWKVVKASNPTTLATANNVAVQFDYSQLRVGKYSVDEWKQSQIEKDANYETTWNELTAKFEQFFLNGLKSQVPGAHPASEGAGDITITVKPQSLQMGKYVVVARSSSAVNANIEAGPDAAAPTDEINVFNSYPASVTQPSVFQHIGYIGENLGSQTGRFLQSKKAQ